MYSNFLGMDHAAWLRATLADAAERLDRGAAVPQLPLPRPLPGHSSSAPDQFPGRTGHFHLAAELFIQASGITRFRIPGEEFSLGPGGLLLLPPRLHHAETVPAEAVADFANTVLIVHGGTLYVHAAGARRDGCPVVRWPEQRSHPDCPRIASWLEDAAACGRPETARRLVAAALERSAALLAETPAAGRAEPRLVLLARTAIQNRLSDPCLSVADIAAGIGCSADYLSHLFRTSTGSGLVEWITELRLNRAAALLAAGGLSSKETAWACGFANQSYFIRLFRRRYGMSPLAWRNRSSPSPHEGT